MKNHVKSRVFLEYLFCIKYYLSAFSFDPHKTIIIPFPFYRCTNKDLSHLPTQQVKAGAYADWVDLSLDKPLVPSHCTDVTTRFRKVK